MCVDNRQEQIQSQEPLHQGPSPSVASLSTTEQRSEGHLPSFLEGCQMPARAIGGAFTRIVRNGML